MYRIITLWLISLAFLTGCAKPSEQATEKAEAKRLKRFFDKFHQLELPYKMVTDPTQTSSNHAVITDLLTQHQKLDSTDLTEFELNMTNKEVDSLGESANGDVGFNFYAIGQVYAKDGNKAILYGRSHAETDENFIIFMATYDAKGKKVAEMVFHLPLYLVPPQEIRRVSELKKDSTLTLTHINLEHKLVNEEGEYMELVQQTVHEVNYKLNLDGKMVFSSENYREPTAEEIKAAQVLDSLRQAKNDSIQNSDSQE